nr:unnamed protein product [Callosobruchus analis]
MQKNAHIHHFEPHHRRVPTPIKRSRKKEKKEKLVRYQAFSIMRLPL